MVSSEDSNSKANPVALAYDPNGMEAYVRKQTWVGTGVGLGVSGAGVYWASYRWPWFMRHTNYPIRAFVVMAGACTGFSIASEAGMLYYNRYIDRGHTEEEAERILQEARRTRWEKVKESAWNHRFKIIGACWASTMAGIIWKDFRNPHLPPVHKFGHARIGAQFVTLGAVIAAFYFNEETGPNAEKYKTR